MFQVNSESINNNTSLNPLFGPDHTTVKWVLAVTILLIIIVGLTGNLVVLIGSLKYKALKMDRVSVILLENIAIADIIMITMFCTTMLITLIAEKWILGEALCVIVYVRLVAMDTEICLITWASCYRLKIIMTPLGDRLGSNKVKICVLGVWVFWLSFVIATIAFDPVTKFTYVPGDLQCRFGDQLEKEEMNVFQRALAFFYVIIIFVPIFIISVSNVFILYYVGKSSAWKGGSHMPGMKALKTVTRVCIVFIFSYVPTIILLLTMGMGYNTPSWSGLACKLAMMMNMIANPIIYVFTNPHFARFLKASAQGREGNGLMVGNRVGQGSMNSLGRSPSPFMCRGFSERPYARGTEIFELKDDHIGLHRVVNELDLPPQIHISRTTSVGSALSFDKHYVNVARKIDIKNELKNEFKNDLCDDDISTSHLSNFSLRCDTEESEVDMCNYNVTISNGHEVDLPPVTKETILL